MSTELLISLKIGVFQLCLLVLLPFFLLYKFVLKHFISVLDSAENHIVHNSDLGFEKARKEVKKVYLVEYLLKISKCNYNY
jgi:F0F1-type ATP synthase membrane subunit b/b'